MSFAVASDNIINCPSCQGQIDVAGIETGSELVCPLCEHEFTLSRQYGNLLLEKQIGAGGMGAVFVGRDVSLDRTVAVKVLKTELVENKRFFDTFLHEAEITAQLNHPNIVQVFGFEKHDDRYFLVMEHISGGTLDDRITENGGVTELEGLEIGIGVAAGLNFAHENGLIHRDIKPGNILFGNNNQPKVVDFGLSVRHDGEDAFAGEIWGTPYYVAPEKLERQPEDFRSDMYSLGATLFHAIAGRPPYDAEDPNEVAMKHLSGTSVSVKAFAPSVSNETAYAIGKAMARHPDERYSSYQEMISQFEDAKRRVLARGMGRVETQVDASAAKRNKQTAMLLIGLIVLTILMVGGAIYFFSTLGQYKGDFDGYDPTADKKVERIQDNNPVHQDKKKKKKKPQQ